MTTFGLRGVLIHVVVIRRQHGILTRTDGMRTWVVAAAAAETSLDAATLPAALRVRGDAGERPAGAACPRQGPANENSIKNYLRDRLHVYPTMQSRGGKTAAFLCEDVNRDFVRLRPLPGLHCGSTSSQEYTTAKILLKAAFGYFFFRVVAQPVPPVAREGPPERGLILQHDVAPVVRLILTIAPTRRRIHWVGALNLIGAPQQRCFVVFAKLDYFVQSPADQQQGAGRCQK